MKKLDDYLKELKKNELPNTDTNLLEETKKAFEQEISVLTEFYHRMVGKKEEAELIPLNHKRGCDLSFPPTQRFVLTASLLLEQETHPQYQQFNPNNGKEILINVRITTKENNFYNLDFSSIERMLENFSNLGILNLNN